MDDHLPFLFSVLIFDFENKKGRHQTRDAIRIPHLIPTLASHIHRWEDDILSMFSLFLAFL